MREPLIRIKQLRKILGLTQGQLARLLNVHPMTISKWEREVTYPDSYQFCMLQQFAIAACRNPAIGKQAMGYADKAGEGIIRALFEILKLSYRISLPDDLGTEDLKLIGYKGDGK